ncbi:MAG: oligosaccharide flippase family protein [Oscillospiraceae bacterium]|nr:oligosaccharide flippase family protein [Oscillospiraceae bacterium]
MKNLKSYGDRQIKLGATLSYFAIGIDIVAGLLYIPWMISKIGKSDYGIYSLTLSFVTMFVMDFGIGAATTRFISKYRAEKNINAINNFVGLAYKLYLFIDVVIFAILFTSYFLLENIFVKLNAAEIEKLKVIFLIYGMFTLISFAFTPLNGILSAFERFSFLKLIGIATKVTTIFFIVLALLADGNVYSLVIVNAAVGLLGIIIKFVYIKKNLTIKINFKYKDYSLLKKVFSFSAFIAVSLILEQLTLNICPTILGSFSGGTTEISYFSIGRTLFTYVYAFGGAINGLLLPKVTRMITDSNIEKVNSLMVRIGRIQLFILGIIITGIFTVGKDFMILWMGKDYISSYYVALLLTLPYLVISTQDVAYMVMMCENKMYIRMISGLVTTAICLPLAIVLSKPLGAIGVSVAFLVASIIGYIIVTNVLYHKRLRIDVKGFFKKCHLQIMPSIILTAILGVLIQMLYPEVTVQAFIIKTFCIIFIYLILVWVVSLNKEEKEMLKGLIKKISKIISLHK